MAITLDGSNGITTPGGATTDDITFADNDKAIFGAGSDLQIYHDGSGSYVKEGGTGSLYLQGTDVRIQNASGEDILKGTSNGAVTLYYDNASKLATTSTGIAVTGSTAHTAGDITNTVSGTYNLNGANGTAGSPAYATYSFKDDPNTGMYRAGTDALAFTTAGSQRMQIDSSGYVLVGTSSARTVQGFIHKVQVEGTTAGTSSISIVRNTNSVDPPYVSFGKTRSGSAGASGVVQQNDILGRIDFTGANGSNLNSLGARIDARVDGTPGGSDMPTRLTFQTSADGSASPTERMRIDSSGNLLVGRTSAGATGNGHSIRGGDSAIFSRDSTGETMVVARNDSQGELIRFKRNNNICGEIVNTGGASVAYNTSSDYRLKENIVDLTGASARINQLDVKQFNFIADGTDTVVDGFLAHEVATVVPEAITGTKDAMMDEEYEVTPAVLDDDGNVTTEAVMGTRSVPKYQGIDQSKLVPLLTAALQEALTEIASLKTRVEALEA